MRYLYSVMASVSDIGLNNEGKTENEKASKPSGMSAETCHSALNKSSRESYWFAHGGLEEVSPKNGQCDSKPTDLKELQLQKDKEERIRIFREQQEEERLKRLKDLEQQFLLAKKHREQQEEERKRRIEEARIRETERRQQVEERKRQIWEAEQERKEAILRRNMEREARIEARRNAQRNSQCFAFGSSTPRTFDLDLAAIGIGRNVNQGSVLMSSVSGRRSEERELGPPRATSACSLDRKFEDISHHAYFSNDQRDFVRSTSIERMPERVSNLSKQIALQHKSSDDMKACLSMWDNAFCDRRNFFDSPSSGWLVGSGVLVGDDCMSRSMVSLSTFRGRKRTDIMPTLTRERSITPHVTPRGKDTSRSPSRPQSSMSGASEISATSSSASAVNMRPRPAPRRPRPFSIAGSTVERGPSMNPVAKKEPERQPRLQEKNGPVSKPQRAKSAGREKSETENVKPLSAPKKPVPPPKSSEVLARAKSHPVPIKDNLRKPVKPTIANKPVMNTTKKHPDASEKKPVYSEENQLDHKLEKAEVDSKLEVTVEATVNSPIVSPTTDSEMCISSDDSKFSIVTESEANTFTQSLTESECRGDASTSAITNSSVIPEAKQNGFHKTSDLDSEVESIPEKTEQMNVEINSQVGNLQENNVIEMESSFIKESTPLKPKITSEEAAAPFTKESTPSKPRITSEEEARAALAEKRRLAREQAEREAELERQRQEEIRQQEEEQRRLEELEQKRMEEEQIRLAELHRQLEEEKLRKAIEEQLQREKEEQEKKEEEARQKAEKEEQERKAREEAERQRIELEERLRKEEEERAERKKRVEQIMARTRGKTAQTSNNSQNETTNKIVKVTEMTQNANNPVDVSKTNNSLQTNDVINITPVSNGCTEVKMEKNLFTSTTENNVSNESSYSFSADNKVSKSVPLPDLLNSEIIANHSVKSNVLHGEKEELLFSDTNISNNFTLTSNRTLSANEVTSPTQTNGYSSHEEMSCTTSPEEMSDTGLLINIENSQQKSMKIPSESVDFTKLVDIETSSFNISNENYLINVDDVNSNLLTSENSFVGYDDSMQKKQDSPIADLLS